MRATFKKHEKLSSKKTIDKLFQSGSSFSNYPVRIVHLLVDSKNSFPVKILISVPKKKFKKAVDRNRIKRQISAAYRINKNILLDKMSDKDKAICIAFIYIGNEKETFQKIEDKIILSLQRLAKQYTVCEKQ